ncbi:MAG: hypothetical protein KAJ40_00600 [Alphaproteobacteria bacterium]|nr:hypothetical protein [Alphaproteobacteria bacterium]
MKPENLLHTIVIVIGFISCVYIISKSSVDYAALEFKHKDIEAIRCLNHVPPIAKKVRK